MENYYNLTESLAKLKIGKEGVGKEQYRFHLLSVTSSVGIDTPRLGFKYEFEFENESYIADYDKLSGWVTVTKKGQ